MLDLTKINWKTIMTIGGVLLAALGAAGDEIGKLAQEKKIDELEKAVKALTGKKS